MKMRLYLFLLLTLGPSTLWADDAVRIRQLEEDIRILKRTVIDQSERIDALERQLSTSAPASTIGKRSPAPAGTVTGGWHSPANWGRVKDGMSQSQVVSLLGQPTSIENIGPYRTLFYRGEVNGSFVSGNAKLTDDRVWQVNEPVF
ncbi:hypothetical protein ACK34G_15935 [Aeromonas veronii]